MDKVWSGASYRQTDSYGNEDTKIQEYKNLD